MHAQQFLALSGLLLASNLGISLALDKGDIPSKCGSVCDPVVDINKKCEADNGSFSKVVPCICGWKQAPSLIPLCEACVSQEDNGKGKARRGDNSESGHDNEVYGILKACSFSTTSYNPTAATSALSADSTRASATATTTASDASSTSTAGSSDSAASTTLTGSASNASKTANAATGISAAKVAPLAALLGLVPFAEI